MHATKTMLIFLISAGVLVCLHPRAAEGGDRIADAVQAEGGARPLESTAPPAAGDLVVPRRNHPVVLHRDWSSHDAQELLLRQERHRCNHYLEAVDTVMLQEGEEGPRCEHVVWF